MTRLIYIFNLDGTLALTDHRQHILDNRRDQRRWHKYFAASVKDRPNEPVIRTMEHLRQCCDVRIWSGCSEEVRPQTIQCLVDHTLVQAHDVDLVLRMRGINDFRLVNLLKTAWLEDVSLHDRRRQGTVLDDRNKVAEAWGRHGIDCF